MEYKTRNQKKKWWTKPRWSQLRAPACFFLVGNLCVFSFLFSEVCCIYPLNFTTRAGKKRNGGGWFFERGFVCVELFLLFVSPLALVSALVCVLEFCVVTMFEVRRVLACWNDVRFSFESCVVCVCVLAALVCFWDRSEGTRHTHSLWFSETNCTKREGLATFQKKQG